MAITWTLRSEVLESLWRWWAEEIRGSLSRVMGRRSRPAGATLPLLVGADGGLSLGPEAALNGAAAPPIVLLPHGSAIWRELSLPPMPAREREAAIALDMRRATPFRADAVRLAYRLDRRRDGNDLVAVAMVRQRVWDEASALLGQAGIDEAEFDIADSAGHPAGMTWAGRGRAAAPAAGRGAWMMRLVALGLVVAWLGALLLLPWWQRRSLEPAHTAAWRQLENVENRVRRLSEDRAELGTALAFRSGIPPALVVLEDLSAVLPDDTYLARLVLRLGDLEFDGFSADAARLIGLLDQSGRFERARFTGAIGHDPQRREDRFALTVRWSGR